MLNYLILILIAFGASLSLTPVVRLLALRLGAVDKPAERKIHLVAVPRLGGIGLMLSVALTLLAAVSLGLLTDPPPMDQGTWAQVLFGSILVFLVGVWDDIRPISAGSKFLWQGVAAGSAIWFGARIDYVSGFGGTVDLGLFAIPVTMLWIVGLTNAFNLIDGLDGLATGLGLIAAATTAAICFTTGQVSDGVLLIIFSGALAGFLLYNFNPATIFLGDSGSQLIGYVLAVMAISRAQKPSTAVAVIIPLLIFGLPLLDTFLSMARRALGVVRRGQPSHSNGRPWIGFVKRMCTADKDHVHHRLLAMGFSHRSAVLTLYAMAAGLSLLALIAVAAQYRNAEAILLIVMLGMYIGIRRLGYENVALMRSGTMLRWCERVVFRRLSSLAVLDIILVSCAFWIAFILKYDGLWRPVEARWYLSAFPFVLIIHMTAFLSLGLYRGVWRAMGSADILPLSVAVSIAVLSSFILSAIYEPPSGVQAFFSIQGLVLLILVLGARSAHKILVECRRRHHTLEREQVIIYGAGRRGEWIMRELSENQELGLRPIGFVDDDPDLIGRSINRMRVLGSGLDLPSLLGSQKVSALIISSPKIDTDRVSHLISFCQHQQIAVFRGQFTLDCLSEAEMTDIHDASGLRRLTPAVPYSYRSILQG